jgi:hypothetical protein
LSIIRPIAGVLFHHMDPAPMSPRLRGSFFANAGVSEEIRQGGIKRTWLGLVILNFVSHPTSLHAWDLPAAHQVQLQLPFEVDLFR